MNNKYLIIPALILMFSLAFVSATYYENADSYSNVDGVWQPEGSYIIDGDWGTGANTDWGGCSPSVNAVLISTYNFTEGSEVSSAIWEVKDSSTTQNISIPANCISSNGIILQVNNDGECNLLSEEPPEFEFNNYISYLCYDFIAEDWQEIIPTISLLNNGGGTVFYEEGLYLELEEIVETETLPTSGGILSYDNLIEQQEEEVVTSITGNVVTEQPKAKFTFSSIINWFKSIGNWFGKWF